MSLTLIELFLTWLLGFWSGAALFFFFFLSRD